jgi:hypothetical protein
LYKCVNPIHRCSMDEESTSQTWLGSWTNRALCLKKWKILRPPFTIKQICQHMGPETISMPETMYKFID